MDEKIISKGYRRVIMSGTTQHISIPREVRELLNSKAGDRVMIAFYYDMVPKKIIKEKVSKKKEEVDETSLFVKEDKEEDAGLPAFDFDGK